MPFHSPFARTPMTTAVEPVTLPPSYDGGTLSDPDSISPVSDLPAYTPSQRRISSARAVVRREPKEFYYELKRNGKLFAILTMISDAAYCRHMATLLEGTPLKGRVRITLDKPDTISSVVVSVSAPPQSRQERTLHLTGLYHCFCRSVVNLSQARSRVNNLRSCTFRKRSGRNPRVIPGMSILTMGVPYPRRPLYHPN